MFLVQIAVRLMDSGQGFYVPFIETEHGLVENATAVVLIPALVLAIQLARSYIGAGERLLAIWYMLAASACVVFLGEEVSWGQHWFGWASPQYFIEHNIQQETNFHNLSKGIERVLKYIVGVTVIVSGFLGPRLRQRLADEPGSFMIQLRSVLPTSVCMPTVAMALVVYSLERTRTWSDFEGGPPWNLNLKETFEFYLALYICVYLASAWWRRRAEGSRSTPEMAKQAALAPTSDRS
jgi:hypothetical protein